MPAGFSSSPLCAPRAPPVLPPRSDAAKLEQQAQRVTIIRDDWGIAHVYGKTDADAVFGMIYAQAEDDFNRVETNYINAMGRLAEAEGEKAIYQDLRMKLFIDPDEMKTLYESSPDWLKQLMNAWADGLNFYLLKHPEVHPRVITHFEPWMALTFSEGSIGGDIESISLDGSRGLLRQDRRRQGRERPCVAPGDYRIQRYRHRAGQYRLPSRPAADQSPHLILLPLRAADGRATKG